MKKRAPLLLVLASLITLIMLSDLGFSETESSKTISLKLDYKPSSVWDSDDDGIDTDKAAIDFTVENTEFNWDIDEAKLCTKWDIFSIEDEIATTLCHGSTSCCNFIDLYPAEYEWDNILYLQYEKYGASSNNKVYAQVIYLDYSLDTKNPYSDIHYSEKDYLYAVFLDSDYFNNALAKNTTSDQNNINIIGYLEKIKANNNIDKVTLTDIDGNIFASNLKNSDLKLNMYIIDNNKDTIITLTNFKEYDINWDNIDNVDIKTEDEDLDHNIEEQNLIPVKKVSINGIDDFIQHTDYNGIVEFDVGGISYDGVAYCSDNFLCSLINKCEVLNEDCYEVINNKVRVFIPHFSSVILILNGSSIGLEIASPDNSTPIESGENVYLNFTTNIGLLANYSFDSHNNISLGIGTGFYSKLIGSLDYETIKNGLHNITIYLMDNSSNILNYNYSFTVNDLTGPNINAKIDNFELNNSYINGTNHSKEIVISSDEYADVSYKLNNHSYIGISLGENKSATINVGLEKGANNLIINASDLQGNKIISPYSFYFSLLPSCSDNIKNGDEAGIDCGGSCNACIPFNISIDKNVFELGENVEVTVLARANSGVNLTVLHNGMIIESEYITSYSPDYPIYVTRTINNINEEGGYAINAVMHFFGYSESKALNFYVNDTSGNPLSAIINANKTSINEGESIGFSSSISGNTSGAAISWNFGDDASSSESNPIHTYYTNGTYAVSLHAYWEGWNKSDSLTIRVRKQFNVIVIVKNESDAIIPDAKIEFGSQKKNTSSEGLASFLVNADDYRLVVSKEYYRTFSNISVINGNITLEVKLLNYDDEDDKPIIKLLEPEDGKVIDQNDVSIIYKVIYSSSVNCTLFLNVDGSWWIERAHKGGITTSSENSFLLQDLDINKHYQWRIECTDDFKNSRMSETKNFYTSSAVATEDNVSFDQIISEIDSILSNLDYLDKNENEAAISLDLRKQLEKAKLEIQRAKRDLYNLVWRRLNGTELEEAKQLILDRVEKVKKTTPRSIKVMESKDFVNYPSKEDVRNISITLLGIKNKKYKKGEEEAYANNNQELQDLIRITTKYKIIEVVYISGENGEITLVAKEVKEGGDLKDISLIESIPKDIAANTSSINALFDYTVILEDPVIRLDLPIERYAYYFNKGIDLDKIKEIKSVVVSNNHEIKTNPILGFAVFGDYTSNMIKSTNIRLFIEIAIILILVMVYIGFSGGFKTAKYLITDRNSLKNANVIKESVEQGLTSLQNNQYEKAKSAYMNINEKFRQLPKDMKKGVYPNIILLSNKLDVFHINKLIDKAMFNIENDKQKEASVIYKQVSKVYKNISPDFKSNVLERCNELHRKLSKS
ncbi:MAG: PKD domain-containing protein [Candidatus Woesearchaeota archaeon]